MRLEGFKAAVKAGFKVFITHLLFICHTLIIPLLPVYYASTPNLLSIHQTLIRHFPNLLSIHQALIRIYYLLNIHQAFTRVFICEVPEND